MQLTGRILIRLVCQDDGRRLCTVVQLAGNSPMACKCLAEHSLSAKTISKLQNLTKSTTVSMDKDAILLRRRNTEQDASELVIGQTTVGSCVQNCSELKIPVRLRKKTERLIP